MKKAASSLVSFTRKERLGISALCILVVTLVAIRATMHLWVRPSFTTAQQQRIMNAWHNYQRSMPPKTTIPYKVDLNTADSTTLESLPGIGPATAHKILAYRQQHPFTSLQQLHTLGRFTDTAFAQLQRRLVIDTVRL